MNGVVGEVVLMVGLPGGGKSTAIAAMRAQGATPIVCSADFWFERDGGYAFDRSQLPQAHQACQAAFRQALAAGAPLIVVDNTNLTARDREPYVREAMAHGYRVRLKVLPVTVAEAEARNRHQVSHDVLTAMAADLDLAPGEHVLEPPAS